MTKSSPRQKYSEWRRLCTHNQVHVDSIDGDGWYIGWEIVWRSLFAHAPYLCYIFSLNLYSDGAGYIHVYATEIPFIQAYLPPFWWIGDDADVEMRCFSALIGINKEAPHMFCASFNVCWRRLSPRSTAADATSTFNITLRSTKSYIQKYERIGCTNSQ